MFARKTLGALAAAMLSSSAALAQISDDVVKIGVLTDMNGPAATARFFDLSFRGASETSEPGIHNHRREYGFRACAKWRIHDVQLHIGE